MKALKKHLEAGGLLRKQDLLKLITDCSNLLRAESNILQIEEPVVIVGDIHGQFYDLLRILRIGGSSKRTNYLFLGDFVDRGAFSIEVMALLAAMKIRRPGRVYLLRGNHETKSMTSSFNFREECLHKFDQEVYDSFLDLFRRLPLAAVIDGKFFALHGGISPNLIAPTDVLDIERFGEPPMRGLFCDLLWADPVEAENGFSEYQFEKNKQRNCSYVFGADALTHFLKNNNLLMLIRGHEVQLEGYKMHRWNNGLPTALTVFSAPNYCDRYRNKGAIVRIQNGSVDIQQFTDSEHPYCLPHFMNVFDWSMPFLAAKVCNIFQSLLEVGGESLADSPEKASKDSSKARSPSKTESEKAKLASQSIKAKLSFVSKIARMNQTLRDENEKLVAIKAANENRIPRGLLLSGKEAIRNFQIVKESDKENEMNPEGEGEKTL